MTEVQMFVIASFATVIVYALNALAKYAGVQLGRGWLTVIVYACAGALAVLWQAPVFPPVPVYAGDPAMFVKTILDFLGAVLVALGPVVAFATLIYNALLKSVLDKLADKIKAKS